MFPSSTKREFRHFHVVVVQRRQRNVQKKAWCTCKVVFAHLNLFCFLAVLVAVAVAPYRERRWKSKFAFSQSLSRLFLLTYFVKCTRALPNLHSKVTYSSSESGIKFLRCLLTRNEAFWRLSRAKTAKKCTKKCDARAKLLFCLSYLLFF